MLIVNCAPHRRVMSLLRLHSSACRIRLEQFLSNQTSSALQAFTAEAHRY